MATEPVAANGHTLKVVPAAMQKELFKLAQTNALQFAPAVQDVATTTVAEPADSLVLFYAVPQVPQ